MSEFQEGFKDYHRYPPAVRDVAVDTGFKNRLTKQLDASEGTDPEKLLNKEADFALEFLDMMIEHDMPAAKTLQKYPDEKMPKIGKKKTPRGLLCGETEVVETTLPEGDDGYTRGYPIGAVDKGGTYQGAPDYEPGDRVVYLCEDRKLRTHIALPSPSRGFYSDILYAEEFTPRLVQELSFGRLHFVPPLSNREGMPLPELLHRIAMNALERKLNPEEIRELVVGPGS
jgi:hypothetical protein